jgi:hypothetical protein
MKNVISDIVVHLGLVSNEIVHCALKVFRSVFIVGGQNPRDMKKRITLT